MAKFAVVFALAVILCCVGGAPAPDNAFPEFFSFLGPEFQKMMEATKNIDPSKMMDPSKMITVTSENGSPAGVVMTSSMQTVMENGKPVQKAVTNYAISKDGKVTYGTL